MTKNTIMAHQTTFIACSTSNNKFEAKQKEEKKAPEGNIQVVLIVKLFQHCTEKHSRTKEVHVPSSQNCKTGDSVLNLFF